MNQVNKFFLYLQQKNWRAVLLLFLVTFAVHSPVLFNGYNLDDELVTRNHRLTSKGISAIPEIYSSPYYEDEMGYSYGYRPTVLASFAIEHELFGESPFVGHLINLLLYAITVAVLFKLVLLLFPGQWWLAFGTALLFSVHPIHTEVVASLKNRDEILALLFGLSACLTLARPKRFALALFIGMTFFFFSMTSKMSGVMLVLFLSVAPVRNRNFFKSTLTILTFSMLFLLVGSQRGGVEYHWGNTVLLAITFFVLRLATVNDFHHSLNKKIQKSKHLFDATFDIVIRYVKKHVTLPFKRWVEMRIKPLSNSKKLEISAALLTTLAVLSIHDASAVEYSMLYLVGLSFILIPSSTMDSFLRCGLAMELFGWSSEYHYFLIIAIGLMSLKDSKKRVALYVCCAFVFSVAVSISLFADTWTDQIGQASFHFVLILSSIISDKITTLGRLIAFSFFTTMAGFIGWQLDEFQGLVNAFIISFPVWLKIVEQNAGNCRPISKKNELQKWNSRLFQFVVTLLLIYSTSQIVYQSPLFEATFSSVKQSVEKPITGLTCYLLETKSEVRFDPNQVWSSEHILSWKRPFDYVEHPLSPFAPLSWKLGTAAVTLQTYLQKLFLPYPLAFYYGFDEIMVVKLFDWLSMTSILLHLLLVIGILFFWERAKEVSIGLIIYLNCIALFSGMAEMVAGMFADRFTYVASFGFSLAVVGLLVDVTKKNPGLRLAALPLSIIVLISFSAYSYHRSTLWKDKVTLMRNDIKNVPNSAQAHNLLGHALMEQVFDAKTKLTPIEKEEQAVEAEQHFHRATEIYPYFFNAWVDKGKVNEILNKPEQAINSFEKALSIDSSYTPLINWIGKNHELLGKEDQAERYYRQFLNYSPNQFEAYDNLARVLFKQNKFVESIRVCEEYLKIDPDNETFIGNIAYMREQMENSKPSNSSIE